MEKFKKDYHFSGYATKFGIKCTDGRVIDSGAFKHHDGQQRPLVWQHGHDDPTNVLGKVLLENREDGVYAYGIFNDTPTGQHAKRLVEHGDVESLSIMANRLKQNGPNVTHGAIREVSLVLAGANPGAKIDNISFRHADGSDYVDDEEAIIYSDFLFTEEIEHSDDKTTVGDVFDTLNDKQKDLVYALVGAALEGKEDSEEEEDNDDEKVEHGEGGKTIVKRNVFEQNEEMTSNAISMDDFMEVVHTAQRTGVQSLKNTFDEYLAHDADGATLPVAGVDYGIKDIDFLFPDHRNITTPPTFISRDMGWVPGVLAGSRKSPFSRIKTMAADITTEEARAKGYVTGTEKKDEVFSLLKRTTGPTTIYKKQKFDRDDLIDITDFDVVQWVKAEMRTMLDEEIARAVLIGDGREVSDPDKIKDPAGATTGDGLRSIMNDADMYAHKVLINPLAVEEHASAFVEAVVRSRKFYKGKGRPALYTTSDVLTNLLLMEDKVGRRLYETEAQLAAALRVSKIVEVEVMETVDNLYGILVNLNDYVIGADKGGAVNLFDDFDIDFNQYKYLIETRISGALVNPKTAIVLLKDSDPEEPEVPEDPDPEVPEEPEA